MLRIHLNNGETLVIDLKNDQEIEKWMEKFKEPVFQTTITGLVIQHNGVDFSFPRPEGFRRVLFAIENVKQGKGGTRVWCFSDEVRIGLMLHKEQRTAARVTLRKIGKQRYSPYLR